MFMFIFLHKKKIDFLSNIFLILICKMYTFDQIFGSKSWTLTQQNCRLFFHQLVLHIVCELFVQWHPINAHNLQTSSILLQLKDLISENMKISK